MVGFGGGAVWLPEEETLASPEAVDELSKSVGIEKTKNTSLCWCFRNSIYKTRSATTKNKKSTGVLSETSKEEAL